jgi:ribosomal protein S1
MAWTYIKHPSEVVRRGQTLRLRVIRVDPAAGKISLSLKQVLPDPWVDIRSRYREGDVVRGKVVRLAASGAFVRLKDVDAFLPLSELAERRGQKVEELVQVGSTVEAVITEIKPEDRRMIVSVRRLRQQREREELAQYQQGQERTSGFTIGAVAGDLLRQAVQGTPPQTSDEGSPETSE